MSSYTLVVSEKKELVLHDRSAKGSAKDVLGVGTLRNWNGVVIVGPGIGFENLALEEVVRRTVIIVGATASGQLNLGTGTAPVFRFAALSDAFRYVPRKRSIDR